MNQDYLISYDNTKYLIHQEEENTSNEGTKSKATISYYEGKSDVLDYRFAGKNDFIKEDLKNGQIKHVYVNSANLDKINFTANETLKETALHINNNNYHIDEYKNRIISDEKEYINNLKNYLPKLVAANNEPIFEIVYFENMPFRLSKTIQETCKASNVTKYGMDTDETAHKGYAIYQKAKNKVKRLNINPVGLKKVQEDLISK